MWRAFSDTTPKTSSTYLPYSRRSEARRTGSRDRIAHLFHIRRMLWSLFRDLDVENDWPRRARDAGWKISPFADARRFHGGPSPGTRVCGTGGRRLEAVSGEMRSRVVCRLSRVSANDDEFFSELNLDAESRGELLNLLSDGISEDPIGELIDGPFRDQVADQDTVFGRIVSGVLQCAGHGDGASRGGILVWKARAGRKGLARPTIRAFAARSKVLKRTCGPRRGIGRTW